MENKYKNLIKDTLIFAVGNIGSKMILFLMVPLYTNFLSTNEYGTADLIFTISQLLIPFVSITIYNGVLRFGLSKNTKAEDVLLSGIVVTGIGSIFTLLITPFFKFYPAVANWKWYISIYVIFSCFNLVEMNYLKVIKKNKIYALISIIQTLILALTNILLLVFAHFGVKGYILSNIIAIIFSSILAFIMGHLFEALHKAKFDKKLTKEMMYFSAPIIINDISWWIIHSSDKIMIEHMLDASILGLYTVATKIPSLINVIISIFSQAWGISSVKEIESTNNKDFYKKVFEAYSFLTFSATIAVILIAKLFMRFYVSDSFFAAWRFIPLLVASAAFSAISSYFGSLYGALKKNIHAMITTIIAAIVNIILNYIFINKIGIWGAIVGTISAYGLISSIRLIDVNRYIKINDDIVGYMLNCILIVFSAIIISFDHNIILFSVIIIVLFIAINFKKIKLISKINSRPSEGE